MKNPCPQCGMNERESDPVIHYSWNGNGTRPDACLGFIPGVVHACCGHGDEFHAYAVLHPTAEPGVACSSLKNEVTLRGEDALEFFRSKGVGPDAINHIV